MLSLSLFLALSLPQDPGSLATPNFGNFPPVFRGVYVDATRGDGSIGVRAETYKLEAAETGVDFIPLFGSRAPLLPIRFRLKEIAVGGKALATTTPIAPVVDGDRITLDRGALVETWRVAPREAEQSFVLASHVDGRDVQIRIGTESTLEPRSDGEDVLFDAGQYGVVHYRNFVVTDALGRRVELPIRVDRTDLILDAPSTALKGLIEPLCFDPVVLAVSVDTSTAVTQHPDAAFITNFNVLAVVYQEQFASNDSDIMFARYTRLGEFVAGGSVDSSVSDSVAPAIAADIEGNMFCVVWRNQDAPDDIRARRFRANAFIGENSESVATVSTAGHEFTDPDVGGSSAPGSDRFLIVWGEHGTLGAGSVVRSANLFVNGGLTNTQVLDPDTNCTRDVQVAVSSTAGAGGHWGVTYRHRRGCASLDHDIAFAAIRSDGTRMFGPTLVQNNSNGTDERPSVASSGNDFFVVFQRDAGSNGLDLIGAGYRRTGTSFTQSRTPAVLSASEPGVTRANDQFDASIDYDGCRYTYVYVDGSTPRPFAATFALINNASIVDFHAGAISLSPVNAVSFEPVIAFTGTQTSRSFVCWTQLASFSDSDVVGALFDATGAGSATRSLRTGCGVHGNPTLAITMTAPYAILGGQFSVTTSNATGTPFLLVGLPSATPTLLCGGALNACRLGVSPILIATGAPNIQLTVPCDPNLVGGEIAFQGLDLGGLSGCTASIFGTPFNVTDTLVVRIL